MDHAEDIRAVAEIPPRDEAAHGSEVDVRVAVTPEEITAAGALTAEAYHADRLIDDGDEYRDELLDAERRSREATLMVAVVPGNGQDVVVGTMTLAPAGTSYAEIALLGEVEVRMLGVAPEARRRGVADELMRAAMRETVLLGAGAVVLSTLDAMKTAQRVYERLGFVREPARDWGHEGVALRVYTWHVPPAPGSRAESATWQPIEVREVPGWRIGLSGGFTRRANSAVVDVVSADATQPLDAALDAVEEVFREAGLPAIVRVGGTAGSGGLDEVLAERGYQVAARTWVMVRDLDAADDASDPSDAPDGISIAVDEVPDDDWLAGWLDVKAAGGGSRTTEVATGIVTGSPALYLTARDADGVAGVIRAAFTGDWVGLSCLMVAPRARRRGIAGALTDAALAAAWLRGARRAFLQVEVENDSALKHYESHGFRPAEHYHYRQR
jgi:ribosomal protein S18 acetylase RimI-like enzyme